MRRFPHPAFAAASTSLLQAFISLLALFRALSPVQHAAALNESTALAIQFSNDCEWLSDEVEKMWLKSCFKAPQGGTGVEGAIVLTKSMGRGWREGQVVSPKFGACARES